MSRYLSYSVFPLLGAMLSLLCHSQIALSQTMHEQVLGNTRAWQLLDEFANASNIKFKGWQSETELWGRQPRLALPFPGLPATTDRDLIGHGNNGAPLMTFIHYNPAASRYIKEQLKHYTLSQGDDVMQSNLPTDRLYPSIKGLELLPTEARIALTGWWPVSNERGALVPQWSASSADIRKHGANSYLNWTQAVLIHPRSSTSPTPQSLAGRTFEPSSIVDLKDFYSVQLSHQHAQALMQDPTFNAASKLALGRTLQGGDWLVLVGLHILSGEYSRGLWATYWWQAQDNQQNILEGPWRHFAMDWTKDTHLPLEADGEPNICFNPWFDGVFSGKIDNSNGIHSNCLNCHLQAAYPSNGKLIVGRGEPDVISLTNGRLRTALLWSLANNAKRLDHINLESAPE